MNYRATVKYVPFPDSISTIDGAVKELEQGEYLIIIDSRISAEKRLKALLHETAHLLYGHFFDSRPIDEIEAEADSYSEQYADKYSCYFKGA